MPIFKSKKLNLKKNLFVFKNTDISFKNKKYVISNSISMEKPTLLMSGVDVVVVVIKNNATISVYENYENRNNNATLYKGSEILTNVFVDSECLTDLIEFNKSIDQSIELTIENYILELAKDHQCSIFNIEGIFHNKILKHVLDKGYKKNDFERVWKSSYSNVVCVDYDLQHKIYEDLLNFAKEQNISLVDATEKWSPTPDKYVTEKIKVSQVFEVLDSLNISIDSDESEDEDWDESSDDSDCE